MVEPMPLLAWLIVGFLAGILAGYFVPNQFGIIGTTLVGMAGAVIGGWLFRELGEQGTTGLSIWSIFVSLVGAIILLIIINAINQRRL